MTDDFQSILNVRIRQADDIVKKYLPDAPDYPGKLTEALCYSVRAGGKRLRPLMIAAMCEAYGGDPAEAEPFMASMEFIHTASLIHDDLPAIDNDELRRGKPTVHAAYGEPIGILSGDALLNYAYEVLIDGALNAVDQKKALKAASIIAKKSGFRGMLGGQGLDVEADKGSFTLQDIGTLDRVYEMKTAALIEASLMSGAALAGAEDKELSLLESIGSKIGRAFQIRDDVLDATSDPETLGKPVHSDEKNRKATYYSELGPEAAAEESAELTRQAEEQASRLSCDSSFLRALIRYLDERDH